MLLIKVVTFLRNPNFQPKLELTRCSYNIILNIGYNKACNFLESKRTIRRFYRVKNSPTKKPIFIGTNHVSVNVTFGLVNLLRLAKKVPIINSSYYMICKSILIDRAKNMLRTIKQSKITCLHRH